MGRYRYKKLRKGKLFFLIILLIIISIISYFSFVVAPKVTTITQEEIKGITTNAVNKATLKILGDNIAYLDLVNVSYDDNGDINLIQVKSGLVNALVHKATIACQENLSNIGIRGVSIPVGTLSGLYFMVGKGPVVNMKIMPVGSIKSQIYSQFSEAGINQTNHKLYLKINASVNILMPWNRNTINTVTEVLLLDSIIVGKVPDTYLNTTHVEDMLDLLP